MDYEKLGNDIYAPMLTISSKINRLGLLVLPVAQPTHL